MNHTLPTVYHPQPTAFGRLLRSLCLALLLFQLGLQPWGFPRWLLLLTTPWNGQLTSLFEVRSIFWPFPWFYVTNFSWPVYWLTESPLYLLPPSPQDPILSHVMHGLAELILTWGSLSMLLPISLDCQLLSRISSCYSRSPSYLTAGLLPLRSSLVSHLLNSLSRDSSHQCLPKHTR